MLFLTHRPSLDGGNPVRWMSCVVERDWATAKERLVENSTKCCRLSLLRECGLQKLALKRIMGIMDH